MAGLIDLKKKVGIVLAKRAVSANVVAQVAFAIDISGSMQDMYNNGTVQKVVDRLLAIASRFDDNGSMDSWAFHNDSFSLPAATEKDFDNNYVKRCILKNPDVDLWGGTSYSPVMADINEHYFGNARAVSASEPKGLFGKMFGSKPAAVEPVENQAGKSTDPVFVIFVTDGVSDDENATRKMIEKSMNKNIYWQFVGIGTGSSFKFLADIADEYPNTGFVPVPKIENISDEDLYMALLNEEFCGWIKQHAPATV